MNRCLGDAYLLKRFAAFRRVPFEPGLRLWSPTLRLRKSNSASSAHVEPVLGLGPDQLAKGRRSLVSTVTFSRASKS